MSTTVIMIGSCISNQPFYERAFCCFA
jgi:hypothetical protein